MGKPSGFMDWPRELPHKRAKAERIGDSREFYLPQPIDKTREQAGRCMDCGIPFCHQGCPLGNLIPDWNELVYRDRWEAAYRHLAGTNDFPEFTGRLCPAPCEAACVLSINGDAVTIEQLEKEIIERAFAEGWVAPRPPTTRTGKRVAIVGSGPAGLAAASQLNRAGHDVTVFERADRPGGLLRYGIPDFKLEKWVIDRRIKLLEAEGIRFQTGVDVGRTLPWDELHRTHDALVIALGARRARELDIPGRELAGIHLAMDYLEAQNRALASDATSPIHAGGKHVVVLGGGDTGSDCVGTAHRQGAASVTQVELLPAPPLVRLGSNPWPQWPLLFRTSSSQEEGGTRIFETLTKRFAGSGGVSGLELVEVDLSSGRAVEVAGTERTRHADLVLLALGFTGPEHEALEAQLGVKLDPRGNIATNPGFETSVPGVFCAGDAKRGASLIVWAISEGRETARAVDRMLTGSTRLPTRGVDHPFGGR